MDSIKVFKPKVSIVIPVFNGSDYLHESIKSALAQTYTNTEVIVINDGSDDDGKTESIALSYKDEIRYFSKENGGVGSALNMAIGKMSGEYFSWLSHDDLYFANKIEVQVKALSEIDDHNVILYSDFGVFYSNPDNLNVVRLPKVSPENFRYFITVMNSLHGCSLLVPAQAFSECGLFDETLRTTQDFDLWFRMAKKYKFIHLDQVLVKARSHPEQGSIKMKDTAIAECNELLSGFVDGLTEMELRNATGKSVSRSYAEIALSLHRRGFYQAAQHAAALTRKNINRDSLFDAFKSALILTKIKFFDLNRFRLMYLNLRLKAKKCFN